MAKDQKTEFKALYEGYGRDDLARAGADHLDGNLSLRSRRHSRWFWVGFGVCTVVAIWLTILTVVYVLERTKVSAERFERQRRERLDTFDAER